ncbi:MAG TPA: DUF1552 domain-containing protein [Polyangia bacterium]|jgi:hypothetical protein
MIAIRTSKTRARLSRRAFLRRLGASAAVLPLLEMEKARGASAYPKRLVTIAWGNGVAQPSFYPTTDDPTSTPIMQPLVPLKDKVTLVAGLDYMTMLAGGHTYDGHFSFPTMFTGTYKNLGGQSSAATGASIDQVVSTAIAKTVNLPVPLMNITVQGRSTSYRPDGSSNTGETKVDRLYSTLFATKVMPSDQVSALTARRKSVIDYLVPELSSFAVKRGTDDRAKIAAHLDSIRQIETSLTAAGPGASCMPVNPGAPTEYSAMTKAFSDLVALAFRCDISRTASLSWADDGGSGPYTMPFLNLGGSSMSNGIGEVHGIAHEGASGYPKKLLIDTWYMSQLAYLATALDGAAEGSGTMLDNSLIVMGNDMSEGSFHSVSSIPFVLVGRAGGALRSGRTVKVGSWATKTGNYWSSGKTGVAHNQLLASISNLMDVPATSFGTGYDGTLAELA